MLRLVYGQSRRRIMNCKRCESSKIVKAGLVRSLQRYKCKDCSYYFTNTPVRGMPLSTKLLGLQLYASGLSLRRTGKLLNVSQVAIQKWIQILVPLLCPKIQPEGRVVVMELDEMWHYIHSKKTNFGSGRLIVSIPVDSLIGNMGIAIEPHLSVS